MGRVTGILLGDSFSSGLHLGFIRVLRQPWINQAVAVLSLHAGFARIAQW